MLTKKRIPNINLTGDWKKDGPNVLKWVSDYLLSLEGKGSLSISEAEITASQGIKFPATQVASSDANTLDDYEEGSWTPTDTSGAGLSFTTADGRYTKVGNKVTAWGVVTFPATASGANAKIGSLPFTVANNSPARGGGILSFSTEATATGILPTQNTTDIQIIAGAGVVTNATMSGDTLYFCVIYPV